MDVIENEMDIIARQRRKNEPEDRKGGVIKEPRKEPGRKREKGRCRGEWRKENELDTPEALNSPLCPLILKEDIVFRVLEPAETERNTHIPWNFLIMISIQSETQRRKIFL